MEKLARDVQRDLLNTLANAYPDVVPAQVLSRLAPGNALRVNIGYLSEHGLVKGNFYHDLSEGPQVVSAKITAAGIDFLADDGGLGAILGVVTVKIHQDSVRALLIQRVEESKEPDGVKDKLVDQLKALPAEGVKSLAEKALDAGIRAIPDVGRWLSTIQW